MKILGLDYGTKKIGLAIYSNGFAAPFKTMINIANHVVEDQNISEICKIYIAEKIDLLVIGLPLNNNNETQSSKAIREFANKIKKNFTKINIAYVDESHTTNEATQDAISYGISKEKRSNDDAFAAVKIIGRYLEESNSKPN